MITQAVVDVTVDQCGVLTVWGNGKSGAELFRVILMVNGSSDISDTRSDRKK